MRKVIFVHDTTWSGRERTKQFRAILDAISYLTAENTAGGRRHDVRTVPEMDDETARDLAYDDAVIFFGNPSLKTARKFKKRFPIPRVFVLVRHMPLGEVGLIPFSWLYGFQAIRAHLLQP